ncbi:MAG TPA: phosphate ABC transporter permease subunit PstC [Gemmatimonadaceae bacterium]|nr:phosphate ABC transporter permease subunit PstC [Gemmatimonadaceae bacterium]
MSGAPAGPPPRDARASRGGARAFAQRLVSGDEAARLVVTVASGAILLVTALLVFELWTNSGLSREKFGLRFLVTQTWDPNAGVFGALPFAYGTVVTSFLSLLIAVPVGVGAAIFLSEMAPPKLSDALTFCIELLAAVPSVIYGLLGVFVMMPLIKAHLAPGLRAALGWTPLFQGPFYGVSFLAAGIVLAVMILPFIVSVSRQVLLAVPPEQREGALALGATKWETTWRVVVPYARRGITGSVFLALARALGETMAVTMVVGNAPQIKASLLAPGYSIAAVIANEFTEATSDLYVHALIELGLVLFALTIVINGVARLLVLSTSRHAGSPA